MTVALVLTKTRMMITENSLKMLYYNTHTVLEQRTFTLQKCTVRSETNCKNQIVVKNLRIVAHRSSLTELNYPDSSEGADKDENYSKIDMSGLMCRQQYLSAGRRNIQFHLHIF